MSGHVNPFLATAAQRHQVAIRAVVDAYRVLREEQSIAGSRERELRQHVWNWYAWTPGCREFWRHGMWRKFRRAFSDGDRTLIPNFDVVAQCLAPRFPEFLGGNNAAAGDDPAARLFDLIAAPCKRLPTAEELADQAAEMAACFPARMEYSDETPF